MSTVDIVGPNGTGKTTIIECFKLACTGEFPPNSRSGHSFIHDPKVASGTEIKAQIKLRFKTAAGKDVVCIRSFQLTQKASKMEFKALEGVLQTINPHTGEKDDSNWPVQDPCTLKKKIDDIFSASIPYPSSSYAVGVDVTIADDYEWLSCLNDAQFMDEVVVKIPYVGDKEALSSLAAEFQSGSPIIQEKIKLIGEQYEALRRIRRDGNCFIRSFMLCYLEHILET